MRKLLLALVVLCMAATSFATVSTNAGRNEYTATAGQTIFNYTFKIYADTDLSVYITASGAEPNDSADITTAYTVTGAGDDAGGSITLDSGATLSDAVTIVSTIPTSRTVDYQFNGDFRADVVNNDFDRAVSLVKQIEDANLNTLRFQNSVQGSPGFLLAPEAGNVIGYDSSGNPTNYDLAVDGNSWDGLADLIDPTIGKGSDLVAHTSTANTVTQTLDAHGVTLGTLSDFEDISLSVDGTFVGNSDTAVPSEKAAKTYVDTSISADQRIAAAVNVDLTSQGSGTYNQAGGVTIDVAFTAHNYSVGDSVYFDATSGTGDDENLVVSAVGDAGNFTLTGAGVKTTSGNCDIYIRVLNSLNVDTVEIGNPASDTVVTITFTSALSDTNYYFMASARGDTADEAIAAPWVADTKTTAAFTLHVADPAGAVFLTSELNVLFFDF